MSALPSTAATAATMDTIQAGLADMVATIKLLGHLALSSEKVSGGEWLQVQGRLRDLRTELADSFSDMAECWSADIAEYQAALAAAKAERAAPGSQIDVERAQALWTMLRSTATVALAQCQQADRLRAVENTRAA